MRSDYQVLNEKLSMPKEEHGVSKDGTSLQL